MIRRVLVVRHEARADAVTASEVAAAEFAARGIDVVDDATDSPDLVLALGGDGTILAAADTARALDVPLLGVNMGHMGFLAEASAEGMPVAVDTIARGTWTVERRMTLDVQAILPDGTVVDDWALNEAAVLRTDAAHPAHLYLVVDGQEVSTYGADGMVLATPTGSTAYSFSAGGPVVWPDMEAIVIAPVAAHGLFTRPLVVGPHSTVGVVIGDHQTSQPYLACDSRRRTPLPDGTLVMASAGARPVRLVRLDATPFSTRLVHKFHLPVRGWRDMVCRAAGESFPEARPGAEDATDGVVPAPHGAGGEAE